MGNIKRESRAKEKRESAGEIIFRAVFMRSSTRSAREHSDLSPKRFPFSWFLSVALHYLVFLWPRYNLHKKRNQLKMILAERKTVTEIREWIGLLHWFDTWSCGQPNDVNMRDIYWAIKLNIWSRIRCNPISRSCVRSNFMTHKLSRRTRQTRQIVLIALE